LSCKEASFDAAVFGLVLKFVRDHESMIREMVRVTKAGGTVAVYGRDDAGGMERMCLFWDAACAANPNDVLRGEAARLSLCQPEPLRALFENAGLKSVEVRAIEITTIFQYFDDFWRPLLARVGAAPVHLAAVSDETCERICLSLEKQLAATREGKIE
jgi:SAM-dependent methyltransferase